MAAFRRLHTGNFEDSAPLVLERKPLISAIASFGSEVTFDCCYEIFYSKYFYGVWRIGEFRVQRSNDRFTVVSKDGEFLLRIKKVEPAMAGDVVCQIWEYYPEHNIPLLVSESRCTLSIVPGEILSTEQMITSQPTLHPTIHSLVPRPEELLLPLSENPLHKLFLKPSPDEGEEKLDSTLLVLNYCRLEDDVFYYLDVTMRAASMASAKVTIRESPRTGWHLYHHNPMFILEWTEPNTELRPKYAIDLKRRGRFVEVGISSIPAFQIKDVEEGEELRIRIRIADRIEAPRSLLPSSVLESSICQLQHMDLFSKTYTYYGVPHFNTSGAFGHTHIVQNHSGECFATKHVSTVSANRHVDARRVFEIMRVLQHTKVVRLIDAFWNYNYHTFVLELLWGGDLYNVISEEDFIQEIDIIGYIRQICQGLQYLHSLQIAHFDIKPENILAVSLNSKKIKIVDFQSARVLRKDKLPWVIYGTKNFVAPEMIHFDELTVACDMWSLGVITYFLLSGVVPFYADDWNKHSANITKINYNFNETAFRDISDVGKDFIKALLLYNPKNRMTASQALNHWWLANGPSEPDRPRYLMKTKDNFKLHIAARWKEDELESPMQRFDYRPSRRSSKKWGIDC